MNLIIRLDIPLPDEVKNSDKREEEIRKIVDCVKTSTKLTVNTKDIKADYWLDSDE